MVRSVISVVAGYAVWTVIYLGGGACVRTAFPAVHDEKGMTSETNILFVYLALSALASVVAGCTSSILATSSVSTCNWTLAVCLLATGLPVQISAGNDLPQWFHLVFLGLLVPLTRAGLYLSGQKPQSSNA